MIDHDLAALPLQTHPTHQVDEETNQLDYFFGGLSDQYIEEVEYKTSTLNSAMEPLIIIFLRLIVGVIFIPMYLHVESFPLAVFVVRCARNINRIYPKICVRLTHKKTKKTGSLRFTNWLAPGSKVTLTSELLRCPP